MVPPRVLMNGAPAAIPAVIAGGSIGQGKDVCLHCVRLALGRAFQRQVIARVAAVVPERRRRRRGGGGQPVLGQV